jgi:ribose 5-phosphate isomerase B
MRVVLGSDHAGFEQKQRLITYLSVSDYEVIDIGPDNELDSVDYPDYAIKACETVLAGQADCAILVCGTGIGMAIAANKLPGIRAANVTIPTFGALCREHNDANVLTLSGRFIDFDTNCAIVDVFLTTDFGGDRHQGRLDKITELE